MIGTEISDRFMLALALRFRVEPERILSRTRNAAVMRARHVIYFALRLRGLSFPVIGRLVDRDHTTVMHGAQAAVRYFERTNTPVPASFEDLEDWLDVKRPAPVPPSGAARSELAHENILQLLTDRIRFAEKVKGSRPGRLPISTLEMGELAKALGPDIEARQRILGQGSLFLHGVKLEVA